MEVRVFKNLCLVCGYEMEDPPRDYNICPSCGTEYGVSNVNASIEQLRQAWLKTGPAWWSKTDPQPEDWNPSAQLANLGATIPSVSITAATLTLNATTFYPLLASGATLGPVFRQDRFDWAGLVWARKPSEDKQPSLGLQ